MTTLETLQARLSVLPQEYAPRRFMKSPIDHIVCADGTRLSVQASSTHYCTPRSDFGPYTHVEVWRVTAPVTEFEYDSEEPSAYVPIEKVVAFIDNHGGIAPEGESK